MARGIHRLTVKSVAKLKAPGRFADGGCLYLQISEGGGKAWLLRYMRHGVACAMGLGPVDLVSLDEARERARAARKLLLDGNDPLKARREERDQQRQAAAKSKTFDECATAYFVAHQAGWKNKKHRDQWKSTIKTYASPVIGSMPVADIDTPLVMEVLRPIWKGKTETASRLRARIESVIDWATASMLRTGDNPARWGLLKVLLGGKQATGDHLPSLPYAQLPEFMAEVDAETQAVVDKLKAALERHAAAYIEQQGAPPSLIGLMMMTVGGELLARAIGGERTRGALEFQAARHDPQPPSTDVATVAVAHAQNTAMLAANVAAMAVEAIDGDNLADARSLLLRMADKMGEGTVRRPGESVH